MNKKRNILILLKIIFIIFLTYVYLVDGKDIFLGNLDKSMTEVFGNVKNLFIPYLIFSIVSDLITDEEKRVVFNIRLLFSIVFLVAIFNLEFLYTVDKLPKENLEKSVFIYFFVEKKLGLLLTMLYYNFYFLVSFNINVIITGIALFFSIVALFGKVIGNFVRKIKNYYSLENRKKRKEIKRLIIEKNKIKKQILEKEKAEIKRKKIEKKLEEEKIKNREEKISKLRNQLKEENKRKVEQLKLQGVQLKDSEKEKKSESKGQKIEENEIEKEEISENQLYFDFEKEEV